MLDLATIKRIHKQTIEHGINPYFDPESYYQPQTHPCAARYHAAMEDQE